MTRQEINQWWQRGIAKERARLTNAPVEPKAKRYFIPTNFSNFAPPLKKTHESRSR